MGFLDKAKQLAGKHADKIDQLKDQHGDKIARGIDKATDAVDKRTGGKHGDKLDQLNEAARRHLGTDEAPDDPDAGSPPPRPR